MQGSNATAALGYKKAVPTGLPFRRNYARENAPHFRHIRIHYRRMPQNKENRMPTILTVEQYRFFFYSNESGEPAHIHVEHGDKVAKFWLHNDELAKNYGFKAHELPNIRKLVSENNELFREKWNEFFTIGK